jgi:sugar O-acyltransferase (sialic acid O-acetyltransferase NeuD family)
MILIGYSGHAYVVCGILLASGKKITGYCDTEEKSFNPFSLPFFGNENEEKARHTFQKDGFFIAIGNNTIREKLFLRLDEKNLHPGNAIHPSAVIDISAGIAKYGVMIAANATINPLVTIGIGVICNTNCCIDHECIIGNFAHIAPGAVLCGNVSIGTKTFVGANAVIKQGITIGHNAIIGAGAVVVKNVPDNATVVGVPAR